MESTEHRVPKVMNTATDAELTEEIHAVLCAAQATLSEDAILAVIAMRMEKATLSVLEELILEGTFDAVRNDNVPEGAPLSSNNYVFCALSEEQRAERRKPQPRQNFLTRVFFAPLNLLNRVSRVLL